MALNGFAPSAVAQLGATSVSSRCAISGTTVLVTNLGPHVVFVVLGNSSVAATVATGVAIPPGTSLPLTVGSNTNLAAITQSPAQSAALNVASGA